MTLSEKPVPRSVSLSAGAAVDVFPMEPLPKDYKLLTLDNITLTNHRGGDTINSYIKAPELLLQQFDELLTTGTTRCLIQ